MKETRSESRPLALVVGASGGVGRVVAQALLAHGWRVRALHRRPDEALRGSHAAGVEWLTGDAMRQADYVAAARGARVIFHGANPPRYQRWRELAVPMLENAIAAAHASAARLIFPGNVYNYGPRHWRLIAEDTPQEAVSRKGAIRIEMESLLRSACAAGGVRVLIVRAGDFFGPGHQQSWLGTAMIKPGKPVRTVAYPGRHDAGHSWAYLPDLAEAIQRLAERELALADFETFHFGGHWFERGVDFAYALRDAAHAAQRPVESVPWWLIKGAAPVVPLFRELLEMRYLWQNSVQLDNKKLLAALGEEPHTPLDEALYATLLGLGCLPPKALPGTTGAILA
jgi:nucleoside-diphosphate-sugar epimerase